MIVRPKKRSREIAWQQFWMRIVGGRERERIGLCSVLRTHTHNPPLKGSYKRLQATARIGYSPIRPARGVCSVTIVSPFTKLAHSGGDVWSYPFRWESGTCLRYEGFVPVVCLSVCVCVCVCSVCPLLQCEKQSTKKKRGYSALTLLIRLTLFYWAANVCEHSQGTRRKAQKHRRQFNATTHSSRP